MVLSVHHNLLKKSPFAEVPLISQVLVLGLTYSLHEDVAFTVSIMLYYVHGLHEGSCGTIQLQDVQTAQYLFGCSYNYKQYTGLFYGDERCPGSSRHEFPPLVRGSSVQNGDYK